MLIIPASQAYLPPADTTPAATTTYEPTEHPAKTPKQPNPEDTVVTTYEPTKRPTETNKVPDPTVTTFEPTKRPTTITEDSTTIKPTRKSVDPSGNTIAGAPKYNLLSACPDTRPSPSPATCP